MTLKNTGHVMRLLILRMNGDPMHRKGGKCLSQQNTVALAKGQKKSSSSRGKGTPPTRIELDQSHVFELRFWILFPRRLAASQWKVLPLEKEPRVCSRLGVFERFSENCPGRIPWRLFPTGKANGLTGNSSSCIPLFMACPDLSLLTTNKHIWKRGLSG